MTELSSWPTLGLATGADLVALRCMICIVTCGATAAAAALLPSAGGAAAPSTRRGCESCCFSARRCPDSSACSCAGSTPPAACAACSCRSCACPSRPLLLLLSSSSHDVAAASRLRRRWPPDVSPAAPCQGAAMVATYVYTLHTPAMRTQAAEGRREQVLLAGGRLLTCVAASFLAASLPACNNTSGVATQPPQSARTLADCPVAERRARRR